MLEEIVKDTEESLDWERDAQTLKRVSNLSPGTAPQWKEKETRLIGPTRYAHQFQSVEVDASLPYEIQVRLIKKFTFLMWFRLKHNNHNLLANIILERPPRIVSDKTRLEFWDSYISSLPD